MSEIVEHTPLEVLLNDSVMKHFNWSFVESCRAELGQLRARIDALENDIICAFCGAHYKADDVPPQHYLTCEQSPLVQRIAEQARQLAAAREIFENIFKRDWTNVKINDKARAWLAANPAP